MGRFFCYNKHMLLIDSLIQEDWLKTPRIIQAFKKIKRVDFLTQEMRDMAEANTALPIGFGQTISQPLVVAFMLELLKPEEGDKILDVGSGSGWTSALLAEIVGEKGKVVSVEIIPELSEFGKNNINKYGFIDKKIVEPLCIDGSKGYQNLAPYDKILCSASISSKQSLPLAWQEQLKDRGRVVAPISSSIWLFVKKSSFLEKFTNQAGFEKIEYPGFVFVPLTHK